MDHLLEFLGEWRKVRPDSRVWEHGAFSTLGSMLDKLTVDQLKVRNENPPPGRWM